MDDPRPQPPPASVPVPLVHVSQLQRWAASGAMALTGLPDVPLGPPDGLVDAVDALGQPFGLDALALLGERAAVMGLWRRGATSCGGSCRLFPTSGEMSWLAVSLPRAEDMDLVPAWLELDGPPPATAPAIWSAVGSAVRSASDPETFEARAHLLGLPVARVGEVAVVTGAAGEAGGGGAEDFGRVGVVSVPLGTAPAVSVGGDPGDRPLVVDLSSLWAGPLCGDLLAGAGASVVKVESTTRPDGARRGPPAFFDLLNGRKRSVALDFTRREDADVLRRLVQRADVVIEASRPRALEQLDILAADAVRAGGPQVWVSITGYGRHGRQGVGGRADEGATSGGRVAFGDDAAAAGGLVVWHGGAPLFCADAVADPLTGLTAAAACLDALRAGGRWLLDVSMAAVSSGLAGPTLAAPPELDLAVSQPRARAKLRTAPALGADTAEVVRELGLSG